MDITPKKPSGIIVEAEDINKKEHDYLYKYPKWKKKLVADENDLFNCSPSSIVDQTPTFGKIAACTND